MEVSTKKTSKVMTNSMNNISAAVSMNGQKLEEVTIAAIAEAILMRVSAEQVPSVHGVALVILDGNTRWTTSKSRPVR